MSTRRRGERLREHCGVIAAYAKGEGGVLASLYDGLCALQHRGQESVGVSTYRDELRTVKSLGLVSESPIFSQAIDGFVGIGHNRYSTTGRNTLENAQPFEMTSRSDVRYALAFNGNITNYFELREQLSKEYVFETTSDAELLGYLLGRELGEKPVGQILEENARRIEGAYSVVMLIADSSGKAVAFRDPLGFRPLCLGENQGGWYAASESVAFADCYMNAKLLRDVAPGEVVVIDEDGFHSERIFNSPLHARCMFEWVYFARPDSVIDGVPVYTVRERLGQLLAEDYRPQADIVVPVPDSGRSAATGFSIASGIPVKEGFQKDRYIDRRTFIMPEQRERESTAAKKLNPIRLALEGKRVLLVDDSIVRGTSMRRYVQGLKANGAKEIHVAVSCPPLLDWCPYGIDFYEGELIAAKYRKPLEEICSLVAEEVQADSLRYNSVESLVQAIGLPRDQLCLACLTREYPTHVALRTREERKR